jgi:hypothetical protein
MIFWLVLKFEIIYRVMISWRILVSLLGDFFWRSYFCMVKYLNFHNFSFVLRYFFNENGKASVWHAPCFHCEFIFLRTLWNISYFNCCWFEVWMGVDRMGFSRGTSNGFGSQFFKLLVLKLMVLDFLRPGSLRFKVSLLSF